MARITYVRFYYNYINVCSVFVYETMSIESVIMPGLTATIGENQGFRPLNIRMDVDPEYAVGNIYTWNTLTTYWRITGKELNDLKTKPLIIHLLAVSHPPLLISTWDKFLG